MDTNQIINSIGQAIGITGGFGNIFNWAIGMAGGIAVGIIMYGGVLYAVSAGNESLQKDAKEWITAAIGGVALLFGAYLLLNIINPAILRINFNVSKLNAPQVPIQPPPSQPTTTQTSPPSSTTDLSLVNHCQFNCKSLDGLPTISGMYCASQPGGCQVDGEVYSDLAAMKTVTDSQGVNWEITGATPTFPPTRDASGQIVSGHFEHSCHYVGTCVDIALTSNNNCQYVEKAAQAALDSGLTIIDNEYRGCTLKLTYQGNPYSVPSCYAIMNGNVNLQSQACENNGLTGGGGDLHISLPTGSE